MTLPPTVAEILAKHVTLEVEGIDRMYLNLYVPILQREAGVAHFWIRHRGHRFASSALMDPMTKAFIRSIERFAQQQGVELITFEKGQRKEILAKEHLARFRNEEGVLFIGKAQEKTPVVRTERRRNPRTGQPYPWLVRSSAMINHYYFYCVDRDFGPFFIKVASYFPYNAKLCINGHEYVKRQLLQLGITFEALDNGILSCEDPKTLQELCDGLSAEKINALLRKWLRLLPHPFTAKDRRAGYRYQISMLQAEFSLTQVLDRPVTGRIFFEEVIRENLDIGRPGQVQLIFNRRVTRQTPGRFRTRVITEGVTPSLHIDYKSTRIKQYHKEARALRTETIINNAHDFEIGKRLKNLSALRKIGFQANRRLLDVQRISHDCLLGEEAFNQVHRPLQLEGQRASALRFGDARVQALLSALLLFRLLPHGFSNRDLRQQLTPLLGLPPNQLSQGRMTYELRRLRLHGLLVRIPKSHRYRVTNFGLRASLFFTRAYARIIRPGLSVVTPDEALNTTLRRSFNNLETAMDRWCEHARLAA
jgi:hypothetical protein